MKKTHLHNKDVLDFLQKNITHPDIKGFIDYQKPFIDNVNKILKTKYKNYLEYLKDNKGDDSSFSMKYLKSLIA